MNRFITSGVNYDKKPAVEVEGERVFCREGWDSVISYFNQNKNVSPQSKCVIAVECYPGVFEDEIKEGLTKAFSPDLLVLTTECMKSEVEIETLIYPDVTDDRIFGYMTRLTIENFFDTLKLNSQKNAISDIASGVVLIIGTGACLFAHPDILIYADMPRWEGQLRFRRNEVGNLGADNKNLDAALQYKRAYFVDWRVADRLKKKLIDKWDYVLDTTAKNHPKLTSGETVRAGLKKAVTRPFRVVPFFDPGPWGGQWMKEVCDLDKKEINYAWCFDCVPEENSLLLKIENILFEIPAINLVYFKPQKLLGPAVYARFGDEFPIRFDFLDTMDGGNLSLQVHPTTQYIREQFGMTYTQDESYYLLDAGKDAHVYLGLKEDAQPGQFIEALQRSQVTGELDAEKFVNKFNVQKHDHILIPAGTVHCSGANSMVLEISATPYIFTFKLWDWGRMGLDGKPRPINIEHGKNVVNRNAKTRWVKNNLINAVELINEGDGWREERTGLHEAEFIETRRHWFNKKVLHDTNDNLNVLNLVEGREAIVESPDHSFEPFIVHYAETFIVPANVGTYSISPYGESENQLCATIKAYVRTKA